MIEYNHLKAKDKGVCRVCNKFLHKALPSRSFVEVVVMTPAVGHGSHLLPHQFTSLPIIV